VVKSTNVVTDAMRVLVVSRLVIIDLLQLLAELSGDRRHFKFGFDRCWTIPLVLYFIFRDKLRRASSQRSLSPHIDHLAVS